MAIDPKFGIAALATALSANLRRKRENALLELQMKRQAEDRVFRETALKEQQRQHEERQAFERQKYQDEQRRHQAAETDRLRSEYDAPLSLMLNQSPYTAEDLAPVMGKGRQYATAPDSASFVSQETEDGPVITFDESKPSKDMLLEDRAAALVNAGRHVDRRKQSELDAKPKPAPRPAGSHGGGGKGTAPGGKIMPISQVNRLSGYASGIDGLERVIQTTEALKERYSGRLSAAQNTVAGWLNIDDPQITAFRAFVRSNLADYVKEISGRAVTDAERRFLATIQPSENDKPETIVAKARQLQEWLSQRRDIDLNDSGAAGYDTTGFSPGYYKPRKPAADAPIPGSEEVR
jgi:hypothetical protein